MKPVSPATKAKEQLLNKQKVSLEYELHNNKINSNYFAARSRAVDRQLEKLGKR